MLNSLQRRWDCIRKSSNTKGVNCKVCWTQWGFQTINRHVYVYVYCITEILHRDNTDAVKYNLRYAYKVNCFVLPVPWVSMLCAIIMICESCYERFHVSNWLVPKTFLSLWTNSRTLKHGNHFSHLSHKFSSNIWKGYKTQKLRL